MSQVKSFRDLMVWQKGMELVKEVYELMKAFPADERFGLTQQLRRAVVSVPANIAEGHARRHRRDFPSFLSFTLGSLAEVETHLEIGQLLGYIGPDTVQPIPGRVHELTRMVYGLLSALGSDPSRQAPPLHPRP